MPAAPVLAIVALLGVAAPAPPHHYVFYGRDRDRLRADTLFVATPGFEGAQVAYTWRQLEPTKDRYDFSAIREDLAFVSSHGRKLWIQLQDVSFMANYRPVPEYLLRDTAYHGGVDQQFEVRSGDEEHAAGGGWMARRWDPAVQERLYRLLDALGREFDGRVEGINLAETAVEFRESDSFRPAGFTPENYRDAIVANIGALKRAFPRSVTMVYGNFMPGEWRPTEDRGYLRAVYDAARRAGVGVGGPDLLPFRPGQLGGSYPLIHEMSDSVPAGIAVQDGNFEDVNRRTGARPTIEELMRFATEYLRVRYVFWGTQEPYYSRDVVPYVRATADPSLRSG